MEYCVLSLAQGYLMTKVGGGGGVRGRDRQRQTDRQRQRQTVCATLHQNSELLIDTTRQSGVSEKGTKRRRKKNCTARNGKGMREVCVCGGGGGE